LLILDEGRLSLPDVTLEEIQLLCRWDAIRPILWNMTHWHKNNFAWPIMEMLWNGTGFFFHVVNIFAFL